MSSPSEAIAAVHAGDIEKVRSLLRENPSLASAKDERGVSALMHSYYRGRKDIAEVILASRSDLDIFEAVASGRDERVSEILDRDPSQAKSWSADGFTPLHFAAFFNQPGIALELVRHGADVGIASMNPMEVAPIHSAAAARANQIVQLLLENGAAVNARQHGGWTALHGAADNGNRELVEMLLRHGADPRAQNDQGKSSLQVAQEKNHSEVAALLARA